MSWKLEHWRGFLGISCPSCIAKDVFFLILMLRHKNSAVVRNVSVGEVTVEVSVVSSWWSSKRSNTLLYVNKVFINIITECSTNSDIHAWVWWSMQRQTQTKTLHLLYIYLLYRGHCSTHTAYPYLVSFQSVQVVPPSCSMCGESVDAQSSTRS